MHVRLHPARTSRPLDRARGSAAGIRALEGAIARAFRAHRDAEATLCMSLEAPLAPAERLLTLPCQEFRILWSPTPEDEDAGVGAAHVLVGTGHGRFAAIRDAAALAFHRLAVIELDGDPAPDPQFFGGFSFQTACEDSALWRGFGDARFVLPRIAYIRRARRAWLRLTAGTRELSTPAGRSRLAWETAGALRTLRCPDAVAPSQPGEWSRIETAAGDWSALVNGIHREIASGRLEKAVAVQCTRVRGECLPPAPLVLERLRTEAADCVRFALSVGDRTFLGASPERIVKRSGERVWTDALAGSIRGDDPGRGQALLSSRKDGIEHAIVVREIRTGLGPLCATLASHGPELLRLPQLAHLRTRFEGILEKPLHVLDLVDRLHPTPAVGGAPRAAALAWIHEHEQVDRGLYAGPFGAFDRAGDGEFVVAIRSGLLGPREAHLFAGAGIVDGSEAGKELAETRWKMRALLAALGVA